MRVLVVGGGAAGIMAAWRAACGGHQTTLLEANGRLGVKLRISGGGKCNITHGGPVKAVLAAFSKDQARFLRPSMHRFTNLEVVELLRREGVETYERDNGRVFPLDRPGSAAQVVAAFESILGRSGVEVRCGVRVAGLEGAAPRLHAVLLEGAERRPADHIILATGGASYPETGTRGEVLGWLKALGLPVKPWFPALAPIPLNTARPDWEGLAFRAGWLRLAVGPTGRRLAEFQGDLVFTKVGISGPAALELSGPVEAARRSGAAFLSYAFDPRPAETLEGVLVEAQGAKPHLAARTWLGTWLPERICGPTLASAGIAEDQRLKDLTKIARRSLAASVTAFPLGAPRPVSLERGEVAGGGLALGAVDAHTLRVKGWENLSVCGELLDIDGPVGGYNLQAAFSTGFGAGESV